MNSYTTVEGWTIERHTHTSSRPVRENHAIAFPPTSQAGRLAAGLQVPTWCWFPVLPPDNLLAPTTQRWSHVEVGYRIELREYIAGGNKASLAELLIGH